MNKNRVWTDEETKLVLDLWHEGKTSVEIGKTVGRTKSSVISRIHRPIPDYVPTKSSWRELGIPGMRRKIRNDKGEYGDVPGYLNRFSIWERARKGAREAREALARTS